MSTDTRVVYGARCQWWDTIDKVSTTGTGLPICPNCGSPLFEVESLAEWWAGVDNYEGNGHPGYRALIEFGRGRCFPNIEALEAAHAQEGTQ